MSRYDLDPVGRKTRNVTTVLDDNRLTALYRQSRRKDKLTVIRHVSGEPWRGITENAEGTEIICRP